MIKMAEDACLRLLLLGIVISMYILCMSTTDNIFKNWTIRNTVKTVLTLIVLACEIAIIITPIIY